MSVAPSHVPGPRPDEQPTSPMLTIMGGIDRVDQNVSTYRVSIRMKKWWWPLFSFLISVSINNAWQLYRLCSTYKLEKLDLLNFTRHIVIAYLQCYSTGNGIRLAIDTVDMDVDRRVLPAVRFDNVSHIIESIAKQRR